jgi:sensor histidine kinase YesM
MTAVLAALVGDREHFPFEERVFHFVMLISALMMVVGTALDVFYAVPGTVVIDILFLLCWSVAYLLSRAGRRFGIVSKAAIIVLIFLFLPYLWLSNGGFMSGPLLCYFLLSAAIICIIFSGRLRFFMLLCMLAVVLGLVLNGALNDASVAGGVWRVMDYILFAVQFLMLLAAIAALIIVYSNMYMKEKALKEAGAKTIEAQYRQQLYALESMEQLVTRLKSERHDFNNHLGVIYGLFQSGEVEKAGAYAASLVSVAEEYQSLVAIPYPTLRAILNYKLSLAREEHIELRLDVNIPPGLNLNEFDLAIIFGNLLDNAIEANRTLEENHRYLKLRLVYKPDYLLIGAENPYGAERIPGGRGHSTKSQPEEHGFGLRNIDYLIKKHSGFMNIAQANGVFKAELALIAEKIPEKAPQ